MTRIFVELVDLVTWVSDHSENNLTPFGWEFDARRKNIFVIISICFILNWALQPSEALRICWDQSQGLTDRGLSVLLQHIKCNEKHMVRRPRAKKSDLWTVCETQR